jgi:hypothetical protein
MATILSFRRKPVTNHRPNHVGEPCQVVFFTGVRYERGAAPDGIRPDPRPVETPVELQANAPN